jgi:hypothetical protein
VKERERQAEELFQLAVEEGRVSVVRNEKVGEQCNRLFCFRSTDSYWSICILEQSSKESGTDVGPGRFLSFQSNVASEYHQVPLFSKVLSRYYGLEHPGRSDILRRETRRTMGSGYVTFTAITIQSCHGSFV